MKKQRLDQLIFEKGLTESRERARTSIMAGLVYVNGQKETKPGTAVSPDATIEVRGDALPYVSRGGLKLEKALKVFPIDPSGNTCADCGASTGGFTDVLLKNGAAKVYAIDVGYGQLAWSLRNDERVICMERTNIRYVTHEEVPDEIDLAVMDLSFISLRIVLPAVYGLLKDHGQAVCLVKPQFEAGKEKVGKKGVVREPETHKEVLDNFVALANELEFKILGLTFSPVKGPEGNIEFLGHLTLDETKSGIQPDTALVVSQAHDTLKG